MALYTIKPVEWGHLGSDTWQADGSVAFVILNVYRESRQKLWRWEMWGRGDDCDDEGTAATFEEAKAQAETAYRERLLVGLTEVPQ